MKIAICDDNIEYINIIEKYLKGMENPKLEYDTFRSGEELISAYKNNKANYDTIFLDMEMGELDGIDTANHIRQIDRHVIIVFVTSHKKYMQRSFECMPFRFLLKPVKFDDFNKVYGEICIKLKDKPGTIVFSENRSRIRVFCDNIIFFESRLHWIVIHTKDGKEYKIRKTIKELIETIDTDTFIRIHRAFIVNLSHIYKISESDVIMHHYNNPIPISRTYKKELTDKFLDFKERKYIL